MKQTVKIITNPTTEAQHQRNVINWSLAFRVKYPELSLLFHVPNGGGRDEVEGRHLKEQGLKKGVPDLCLPVARGKYHALYIELKTEDGRPSEYQKWWIEKLNAQGCFAEVCHGWKSAVKTIEWYLNLSKGEKNAQKD